jgi:ABC-type antimicrobial peptide transport system permease subunit
MTFTGIKGGVPMPCFITSEDFIEFNRVAGLLPVGFELKDGHIAMSDILKRNLSLDIGDSVELEYYGTMNFGSRHSYKLAETYDAKGYTSFYVDSSKAPDSVLLLREDVPDRNTAIGNLDSAVAQMKQDYQNLRFIDYQYQSNFASISSSGLWNVINPVLVCISVVLAITINAIMVGEYANRRAEFSIYKAAGFSKRDIIFKITKETLMVNLIGLGTGAILVALFVFTLNEAILFKRGMRLPYYCHESVIWTIAGELAVIVPVIIFQVTQIRKHDITEY